MSIFLLCGLFLGLIIFLIGFSYDAKSFKIIGGCYFILGLATLIYCNFFQECSITQQKTNVYQYEVIKFDNEANTYTYKIGNSYYIESILDKEIKINENDDVMPSITKNVTIIKHEANNIIDKFLNIGMQYKEKKYEEYILVLPTGTIKRNVNN